MSAQLTHKPCATRLKNENQPYWDPAVADSIDKQKEIRR